MGQTFADDDDSRSDGGVSVKGSAGTASDTPLVTYKGGLINIESVLQKLEENVRNRALAESKMKTLEAGMDGLRGALSETASKLVTSTAQLKDSQRKQAEQAKAVEEAQGKYSTYEKLLVKSNKMLEGLTEEISSATHGKEKKSSASATDMRKSSASSEDKGGLSKVKAESVPSCDKA